MDEPAHLDPAYLNRGAGLPYGLTVDEVAAGVAETYRLFHRMNDFLVGEGFARLEQLVLGNSLSGIISEFLVKNVARASDTLVANTRVGGHPDLLPAGHYDTTSVLKGDEGIEVKASIRRGGWQGHNPEDGWVIVFRYLAGRLDEEQWIPLRFVEILCAWLKREEWKFPGRSGTSRRTPTASIARAGTEKLRANFIYREPGVGVGRHQSILAVQGGQVVVIDEEVVLEELEGTSEEE